MKEQGGAAALPDTCAVLEFDHFAAGECLLGERFFVLGWLAASLVQEVVESEADALAGKEAGGEFAGGFERALALFHGVVDDGNERGPVHHVAALQLDGLGFGEAGFVFEIEYAATFVHAPAAGATEHLQQLIRAQVALSIGDAILTLEHEYGTHREVDAGCESGGGDDDFELVLLGEWFDQPGALGIAHAAVVEGDAGLEAADQFGAGDGLLFGAQYNWIGLGECAARLRARVSAAFRRGAKMRTGPRPASSVRAM